MLGFRVLLRVRPRGLAKHDKLIAEASFKVTRGDSHTKPKSLNPQTPNPYTAPAYL